MRIIETGRQRSLLLIRLMVGAVFLSEGIQKFLFAQELGSGRFEKIGIPYPDFFGPFVGAVEISCGILLLLGFLSRLAAIPLIVIMIVALATTKTSLYQKEGFWAMLHGSRTDWAMLLGSLYLLINGAGRWSVDRFLMSGHKQISRV